MIAIYALRTEGLPSPAELLCRLRLDVGEKFAAWKRMPERQAKESITGMLLLQAAMRRHGIRPDGRKIKSDFNGRPFLAEEPNVDFNISHTDGLAVCAWEQVTAGDGNPRVGVDAECRNVRSSDAMRRIASRWFTPKEQEAFAQELSETCFLRIWTGKEAIVKWTGEGLSASRTADTLTVPPVSGAQLHTYMLPRAVVSLCCRAESIPPESLRFLGAADLEQ